MTEGVEFQPALYERLREIAPDHVDSLLQVWQEAAAFRTEAGVDLSDGQDGWCYRLTWVG